MKDAIQAIEFLGAPAWVAIMIVGILLVIQVVGCILDFKGKVVPDIINIRGHIRRKKQEKEAAAKTLAEATKTLKEVKKRLDEVNSHYSEDNITKRNEWMNCVNTNIATNDTLIHNLDKKLDKLLDANKTLGAKIERVEDNVLTNEADRLRAELFDCGNRCRRHIRLHPEEMNHIRDVYSKYSDVLKQNGLGEKEFNFIMDYYNHQDFPDYHEKNK